MFIPEGYTFKYTEGNKVSDRVARIDRDRYLLESWAPKGLLSVSFEPIFFFA